MSLSHSQLSSRSRVPEGGSPRAERATSGVEQPLPHECRGLRAAGDHQDLRVAVQGPGVVVDRAEADDVVGDHDLGVDDGARHLPHLGARRGQLGVAVPQRRRRREVVRLLGDDDPHLHPAPGGRQHPLDDVGVGEVRVHHVEALTRRVDLLPDGLRGRDEAAGDHLREGDRRRAGVGRRGEVPGQVGGQRPPVAAKARQERRLRLPDDVTGDAHHQVVEAAVVEVILDAGSARPGDAPVDDVQLAMVGAAELVQAPRRAAGGEEADPVGREDVVDDDLRARRGEPREHLARLPRRAWSRARRRSPAPRHPPTASAPAARPSASPPHPPASRT